MVTHSERLSVPPGGEQKDNCSSPHSQALKEVHKLRSRESSLERLKGSLVRRRAKLRRQREERTRAVSYGVNTWGVITILSV